MFVKFTKNLFKNLNFISYQLEMKEMYLRFFFFVNIFLCNLSLAFPSKPSTSCRSPFSNFQTPCHEPSHETDVLHTESELSRVTLYLLHYWSSSDIENDLLTHLEVSLHDYWFDCSLAEMVQIRQIVCKCLSTCMGNRPVNAWLSH